MRGDLKHCSACDFCFNSHVLSSPCIFNMKRLLILEYKY